MIVKNFLFIFMISVFTIPLCIAQEHEYTKSHIEQENNASSSNHLLYKTKQ